MANDFPRLNINTRELLDHVLENIEIARSRMHLGEDFGAVNWGDIGVSDIQYRLFVLDKDAQPFCIITVEEASPDCELGSWLNGVLDHARFPNCYVECEW